VGGGVQEAKGEAAGGADEERAALGTALAHRLAGGALAKGGLRAELEPLLVFLKEVWVHKGAEMVLTMEDRLKEGGGGGGARRGNEHAGWRESVSRGGRWVWVMSTGWIQSEVPRQPSCPSLLWYHPLPAPPPLPT
jgi:hypothetical protein